MVEQVLFLVWVGGGALALALAALFALAPTSPAEYVRRRTGRDRDR